MDKLDELYTIRIPSVLKTNLEKLSNEEKTSMHNELRLVMAKCVHLHKFDPSLYLSTEDGNVNNV